MFKPEVFEVAPDLYCLRRRSYLTCSYLVVEPSGIVLVDAGMKSDARDVRFALRFIGREMRDVTAVLLTHWHNDHSAGAGVVRAETGAPVHAHPADAVHLTGERDRVTLSSRIARVVPEWGPFVLVKGLLHETVTARVADPAPLADGDLVADEFEVVATPGHTPGHVCFYHRKRRALFAGDALAVINGRPRLMARPVTPDLPAARASAMKCLDRDIRFLCPGHRHPLHLENDRMRTDFLARLATDDRWPLFG